MYIDGSNQGIPTVVDVPNKDKIPFSKIYKTYNDYVKDYNRAFELAYNLIEIPDDLYYRLKETADEIGMSNINC